MPVDRRFLVLAGLASLASPAAAVTRDPPEAVFGSPDPGPWSRTPLTDDRQRILIGFSGRLRRALPDRARGGLALFPSHLRLRLPEHLLFESGTAAVHPEGTRLLTDLAWAIIRDGRVRAEVAGHHHSDGQSYRSYIISARRAVAVQAVLLSRRVPPDRLIATGLGENYPLESNRTPEGRAANRRIEVIFLPA